MYSELDWWHLGTNKASEAISEDLISIFLGGGNMPSDPPSVCVFTHAPSSVPPQSQIPSVPSTSTVFTWRLLFGYSLWNLYKNLFIRASYMKLVSETVYHLPPPPPPPGALSILVIVVPFKCTVFIPIKRMIQPTTRKLNSGNLWVDPTLSKSPPILGWCNLPNEASQLSQSFYFGERAILEFMGGSNFNKLFNLRAFYLNKYGIIIFHQFTLKLHSAC